MTDQEQNQQRLAEKAREALSLHIPRHRRPGGGGDVQPRQRHPPPERGCPGRRLGNVLRSGPPRRRRAVQTRHLPLPIGGQGGPVVRVPGQAQGEAPPGVEVAEPRGRPARGPHAEPVDRDGRPDELPLLHPRRFDRLALTMTDRPTISVHQEEFDVASNYKEELDDDVTWGDILVAGAKTLAGDAEPQAEPNDIPEDVLTEDHLEDIKNITSAAVEEALRNHTTRP